MRLKITAVALVTVLVVVALAEWPHDPSGTYFLRWGAVTNGGTDSDVRMAPGYYLTDNLGSASYVADSFLSGGTYINRPGYRKIEWDEREPITSVNDLGADTISSTPTFVIAWGGADTTIEDGIGWGILYYDVQFMRNAIGSWEDWYTHSTLTSDVFGPFSPDTVFEDTTYYFRCRAYDKAGNVEDWPATAQAYARYEAQILQWVVVNYDGGSDWRIADSVGLSTTTSADSADVFIVKNNGSTTIDIGIKGNPATGWDLESTPGIDDYTLKARFNDNNTPPVVFEATDVIFDEDTFTWATASRYGIGGFGIEGSGATPAPDSSAYTENLWLQLLTPTDVTAWVDSQIIIINLKARTSTP